jgi:hypothetical protein
MSPQHFIEKCRVCGTTISQCRCPAKDKSVRLGICDPCGINLKHNEQLPIERRGAIAEVPLAFKLGNETTAFCLLPGQMLAVEFFTRDKESVVDLLRNLAALIEHTVPESLESPERK